ncbi:MAG: metal ABC transporter permease [Oscillospiraceae bacterium]
MEIFQYEFFRNAIAASILSSIVCSVIGVIIVQKGLLMMSGGIAHTAYGGVGLAYLLGFSPMVGAAIFAVGGGLIIGRVKEKQLSNSDIIIAMLWSVGMALGIAFVGLMPGYPPDITSYLFGNILSVTKADIKSAFILTCIVVLSFITFYNDWITFLFDEEFSAIRGIKTRFLSYFLLVLISLTVVVLIRVAGIIMVIALLSVPASCSALLTEKFNLRILYSAILGTVFCLSGLFISYFFNIASGASIVILSVLCYSAMFLIKEHGKKKKIDAE